MNADVQSDAIPQAPPLPAQPFAGVRHAAYRIIGLPSSQANPKLSKIDHNVQSLDRFTPLIAGQNATISHRTGLPLRTISINDRGTHALIGGAEIFKTVKIENGICIEDRNLRTAIRSTPTQASGHVRQVYSIDIADVAWAKGDCGDYVAAATASGKIILYDLGHAALQAALLHEHARQVHKVTFNPHRGSLLLSGSQDGTVRLWDVRDVRTHVRTLNSKRKFSGQSDGVRDVKWSPTDGVDFAFGTDSGWIQRWDMRNLNVPKIRIPAHQSSCTSLDWHPDGKHIASAGMDKVLRIWDFTSTRIHKPVWEVRTPYPISNARWRPACESSMPHDDGARMCTQIVTAYDEAHPIVHVWDLRRPAIPFRMLTPYNSAPTDLLWHSQDLLWTVGREGIFQQTDVQHATKVMDRTNLQAVATAANGSTTFATQRRHTRPTPRHHSLPKLKTPDTRLSQSPESIQLSRSWADDSLDHSFLSAYGDRRTSQVKVLSKSARVMSTPPSGLIKYAVIGLNDVLLHRQSFTPPQAVFHGVSPLQTPVMAQLEEAYMTALSATSSEQLVPDFVEHTLEQFVTAARSAKQWRLAQTWQVIASLMRDHIQARVSIDARKHPSAQTYKLEDMVDDVMDNYSSPHALSSRSSVTGPRLNTIAQTLAMVESNSNATTPLATAVSNHQPAPLPNIDTGADLDLLPPSDFTRGVVRSAFGQDGDHTLPVVISDAQPYSTTNSRRRELPKRPPLLKHDSDESFDFMVGSQSSQGGSSGSLPSDTKPSSMVRERPSRPMLRVTGPPVRVIEQFDLPEASPLPVAAPQVYAPHISNHTSEAGRTGSMQGSRELPLPTAAENEDILRLRSSLKHDVEGDQPFTLQDMVQQLIAYYTTALPNPQTAAYLFLALSPLLPETHPLEQSVALKCLSKYAEIMIAEFDIEDVGNILIQCLGHLIQAGIHPFQLESVLSTHHEHLMALQLHQAAANLRNLAYPIFPALYEYGLGQDDFTYTCGLCGQRLVHEDNRIKCLSCEEMSPPCPVCLCEKSPFGGRANGSLLAICLLCTHNSHVGCASEWFGSTSGRRCPTAGCLCACSAAG